MTCTLFGNYRSSATYRARIALNLKGLAYETHHLDLPGAEHRRPEYLQINPQGLVPALEHDGRVLNQSAAIVEYLDEVEPEPPLLPAEPASRAIVRAMAMIVACDIHPVCNMRVRETLRGEFGQDDEGVARWCRRWIADGFAGLEPMVAEHGGECCFGDRVSLADVFLVPQMYNARAVGCDLAPYPRLTAVAERLEARPAFAAAAPEAQPERR